jgi:ribonuclease BN (tRNA processing enzyme)
VGDLSLDEMAGIQHVLLTHSHLDHVAALPLMLDAVALQRLNSGAGPLQVHALPETIATLQAHIFNQQVWPDFTRIPSPQAPLMRFVPLQVGQQLTLLGKIVEVLPAAHSVPAVGFAVLGLGSRGHWVYSGDTGSNPAFWHRINQIAVSMLVIETAFSNQEADLAARSQHLAPSTLAAELAQICISPPHTAYPVYITHTKPAETAQIMQDISRVNEEAPRREPLHDIRWLSAGMQFEV